MQNLSVLFSINVEIKAMEIFSAKATVATPSKEPGFGLVASNSLNGPFHLQSAARSVQFFPKKTSRVLLHLATMSIFTV